jgi:hypothetical protein
MVILLSDLMRNSYNEIGFTSIDLFPCIISQQFSPLAYKKIALFVEDPL